MLRRRPYPPGRRTNTRVAYATCVTDGPDHPDDELPLLIAALRHRGFDAEPAGWDDRTVDWSSFAAVLVRSTWDYASRRGDFLAWARGVAAVTTLLNPYDVIAHNTDKAYLRGLEAAGIAVVPTVWVGPEDALDGFPAGVPDGEIVVKPSVSASGRDTLRTADGSVALAHLRRLTGAGRTAMVQPYLAEVEAEGELSLVFLGGELSHCVRRSPLLAGAPLGEAVAIAAAADVVAFARAVLAATPRHDECVYARVDVVRVDGQPVLMELELTEPYLFLPDAPASADRLAAAVERAVCG